MSYLMLTFCMELQTILTPSVPIKDNMVDNKPAGIAPMLLLNSYIVEGPKP